MGKSAAVDIQVNINERVSTLELEIKESREAVEAKEALIQQYAITIEELRSEILIHERKAEEEAKNNGLFGRLQGAINDAMYKKKYEEVQKRLTLQQEEFNL